MYLERLAVHRRERGFPHDGSVEGECRRDPRHREVVQGPPGALDGLLPRGAGDDQLAEQ
jgi:hypothetical protein